MITMTFFAPSRYAIHVQNLVKKYNGRFVHNPIGIGISKDAQFKISFDNSDKCNKFSARYHILNQPWV